MEGLQSERVTADAGTALVSAEVSEPRPGAEACNSDNQTVPRGRQSLANGFRSGFPMAVEQDVPVRVHEADRQPAGVQVDATGTGMGVGVEAPEVSSS
jgi:hypothetical protein